MFLCASVFVFYVVSLSSVFSEKTLLCSSEYINLWYSYEGPVYYLSATGYPCHPKTNMFNITYTIIPMVTIARAGYHARVYYQNQLWFEYIQPDVPCEDIKICYIMKGETLHETCPLYFKRHALFISQGEYHIYVNVHIVDDAERTQTLHVNLTLQVKSTGRKDAIFQQLGGLGQSFS